MEISILVAVAKNGVIGKDNSMLWKLSDDFKSFKQLTLGHVIIMGRKTFESIGKPLPGRTSIVISRNSDLVLEGCKIVNSVESALELAKQLTDKNEVFIIGGQQIYELAQPFVTKIYLTKVNTAPEGDAFFDTLPYDNWEIISVKSFSKSEKNEFDFEIDELVKPQ